MAEFLVVPPVFLHRGVFILKKNVVTSDSFSWHRLLRRSIHRSVILFNYPPQSFYFMVASIRPSGGGYR